MMNMLKKKSGKTSYSQLSVLPSKIPKNKPKEAKDVCKEN
jgi:hypothetical protein